MVKLFKRKGITIPIMIMEAPMPEREESKSVRLVMKCFKMRLTIEARRLVKPMMTALSLGSILLFAAPCQIGRRLNIQIVNISL